MSNPTFERPEHSIAMWGAPGSGKTTMLAALSLALIERDGPWKLVGADANATSVLLEKSAALDRQEFPLATIDIEKFRWLLVGSSPQQDRRFGGWRGRSRDTRAPKIGLNMIDPPGQVYAGGAAQHASLLQSLEESRGIIYLFDPTQEYIAGDAFDYLHGALLQLASQMLAKENETSGRLPHYLAVCITKFDDLRVLKTATKLNVLTQDPSDPHEFPTVEDADAPTLFRELCEISARGSARRVLNALERFFHKDRLKFFVTSSIGFYLKPGTAVFDPRDFQNMVRLSPEAGRDQDSEKGAQYRIRGQARPINVCEPVIWLAERLLAERQEARSGR
ncbi:hypothetical protein [Acrocarpospora catenulata]|uniref:hypothetical protein n=1 Tax=Acrocarpospora catenulata TaxID=2836182 RepID=UPI001BD9233C|nr:hypothetical protein [Acrocarpospora catenulata]